MQQERGTEELGQIEVRSRRFVLFLVGGGGFPRADRGFAMFRARTIGCFKFVSFTVIIACRSSGSQRAFHSALPWRKFRKASSALPRRIFLLLRFACFPFHILFMYFVIRGNSLVASSLSDKRRSLNRANIKLTCRSLCSVLRSILFPILSFLSHSQLHAAQVESKKQLLVPRPNKFVSKVG